MKTRLEVIATTLEDAIAGEQGGADSLEICYDLPADGLTPDLDLVKAIRDSVKIDLHVILRPHNNGFVYLSQDVDLMLGQAQELGKLGIQSLVFAALTPDGKLDVDLITQISCAASTPLTVHRAIDHCTNSNESLTQLTGIAHRILASGMARSAWDGREVLRDWVREFGSHYRFAAAGGIRLENAHEIITFTAAHECHVGSAVRVNDAIDVTKVSALVEILAR